MYNQLILGAISFILVFIAYFIFDPLTQKATNINNQTNINPTFFSRYHTNLIRSLGAFLVVFCHIGYPGHNRFWGFWGGVAVLLFLLVSGYGVNESYKKNGLTDYFKKRLLNTAIPYWIMTLFMWFYFYPDFSVIDLIKQMLFIDAHYYWFIQFIIVQYIIFYLIMRFIPSQFQQILGFFMVNIAILIINPSMSWGSQMLSFFVGYLISTQKSNIKIPSKMSSFKYSIFLFILGFCFLILKQLPIIRNSHYLILNVNQLLLYMSFGFSIILFTYFTIQNKFWTIFYYSGRYSFNIYIISWFLLVEMLTNEPPTAVPIIIYLFISYIVTVGFTIIANNTQKLIFSWLS